MSGSRVAFNTANLVARVTGYQFELEHWGRQHDATAAATDEAAWRAICREIADAGYTAVEVWLAHIDPRHTEVAQAERFRAIMDEHGLTPAGLAGAPRADIIPIMTAMGIDTANSGLFGVTLDDVRRAVAEHGVRFNLENHPEKSVQEIRDKIAGGSERIGVAIDTGWLGTQGVDAPAAIRELGPLVRHVHVKDVRAAGAHETVPLGEGCVDLRGVFHELKRMGYAGWLSWEDEPEDRNPMEIAAAMREWIEATWEAA